MKGEHLPMEINYSVRMHTTILCLKVDQKQVHEQSFYIERCRTIV